MKPQLLLVGLGNPGAGYERTRHNAGFLAIDRLSKAFGEGEWKTAQKFTAEVQEACIITVPVLLTKPQTFMNLSGDVVRKLVQFYKIDPASQLIVFSDDVDLDAGTLRFRAKGGPGTHNGLKSIVDAIGEGFPRVRIGIGPQPNNQDLAAWVLSAMTASEVAALKSACDRIPAMIRNFVLAETEYTNAPGRPERLL